MAIECYLLGVRQTEVWVYPVRPIGNGLVVRLQGKDGK